METVETEKPDRIDLQCGHGVYQFNLFFDSLGECPNDFREGNIYLCGQCFDRLKAIVVQEILNEAFRSAGREIKRTFFASNERSNVEGRK